MGRCLTAVRSAASSTTSPGWSARPRRWRSGRCRSRSSRPATPSSFRGRSVGLLDADPRALQATTALAQRVGRAMRAALGATGIVVLSASGVDAGQSVPHLHLHVVPCWDDDGVTFWPDGRSQHRVDGDPHAFLAEMFE